MYPHFKYHFVAVSQTLIFPKFTTERKPEVYISYSSAQTAPQYKTTSFFSSRQHHSSSSYFPPFNSSHLHPLARSATPQDCSCLGNCSSLRCPHGQLPHLVSTQESALDKAHPCQTIHHVRPFLLLGQKPSRAGIFVLFTGDSPSS